MRSLCLSLLILLAGCLANHADLFPGARILIGHDRGHQCDAQRGAEAGFALQAVIDEARDQGVLLKWPAPDGPVSVCVTGARPYVLCGARVTRGCGMLDGSKVYVTTHARMPGAWRPRASYDWKRVLIHELILALANRRAIDLPPVDGRNEAEWLQNPMYSKLLNGARARLK